MISNDIKIVEKVIKKQKEKGIDEKQIYKEAYDFLLDTIKVEESYQTQQYNKQISDGINKLSVNNKWTNLLSVSQHAITCCLECIKKDKTLNKCSISDTIKFKSFILHSGKNEFIDYLTDEAKKEFFPKKEK